MKASQLLRGYLATKTVILPLAGSHARTDGPGPDAEPGSTTGPAPVEVGLVPLSPGDEAVIYDRAGAYARAHGLERPQEGDELYEYGKALWRCLLGTVDPDAPTEKFFDGGLAQLEGMTELGKDGVLSLAEMHQVYSDEVSGLVAEIGSDTGFAQATKELAGPNGARFFFSLRPGLRVTWALTSARLHVASAQDKSPST